ncbi:thiamine pyrophosphate-binding protein [Intrasporangium sp.]|uniref:thiamine pyrophosphate-binding protein n=1 Tax=Intrasporangium sp. TaxID=1925024 RepID=UPI00336571EE
MYFHEAFARALQAQGVTDVFGVLGDANLYLIDSWVRNCEGRFYSVSNEAGGVLAANGFGRTTGGLGVATVTHGPALTNTVTALVESVRDHTPLLLIAGDTDVVDRENFQNIAQRDVVMPTGAGFEQLRSPQTVAEDVAVAVRRAQVERRPIVLNVPAQFQWQQVDDPGVSEVRWVPPQAVQPSLDALDAALGVIASARRPIVLAGQGASSDTARAALVRLASRIGAPLATTLRARDLFRSEPHDLGVVGTLSHDVAADVVDSADCIIAFGAGLNKWTTAEGSVLAGKGVVHVDSDPASLARFQTTHADVIGDVAATADAIVRLLDEAEIPSTGFASDDLAARLAQRRPDAFTDLSTEGAVDLRTAMIRLDEAFPRDRALVFDGGRWIFNAFKLFHVEHPRNYVHTVNFGAIGMGMGNAIGAAVGSGLPTLLCTGDGGFMLGGLAEFNTAVRHGLDLVVVVFNDMAYGAEHIQFRNKNMDPALSTFEWPEFAEVATALGGTGHTVRNLSDLDVALKVIEARDRPVLIDIKIDPDKVSLAGH